METEEIFDEIIDWISLLLVELITSFTAVILMIISVILLKYNHFFWGVILFFLGLIFIGLFIGAFKSYLRGKNE